MKRLIVAIDGPAGAGKTTVSRLLARRLGYRYIDTGALYRGVAYEARSAGVGSGDDAQLAELCRNLKLELVTAEDGLRLLSNDLDITEAIRTPDITILASAVSARPVVRKHLLEVQRDMGRRQNVVVEGRDMGTVVFPDADVKFFLDASPEVRALRRFRELKDRSDQNLETVEKDMRSRDRNDASRRLAPLKPAPDAVIIDATDLTAEAVVERMIAVIEAIRQSDG